MKRVKLTSILLGLLFLLFGIFTLPDYGINWDTINHLPRGQSYLNFFLTGNRDYSNLESWEWYWQRPESLFIDIDSDHITRRSMYQTDAVNFDWLMQYDGRGHPPLSDILSALFNRIFFGQLSIINDIDSYRVYGVFLSSLLIVLIYRWVSNEYGNFAGFVSVLSLALYPLFWAESHFNTEKDIPETVYWSFFVFSVWSGVTKKSWKWMLLSGIFFGLALGTKFNILFALIVLGVWSLFYYLFEFFNLQRNIVKFVKKNWHIFWSGVLGLLLGVSIFILSWPYLWADPISRINGVVGFYRDIGLTQNVDLRFLGSFGFNTYPLIWIFYTTPLVILILFFVGFWSAILRINKEKSKLSLLVVIWFVVSVGRVSLPGANIYGGVRQIMEYIPAMAILSGLGSLYVFRILSRRINRNIVYLSMLFLFIPVFFRLASIHPFENVYFNSLAGGLAGAKEKNIPSWGNTFGAAYRKGFVWINNNADRGSKVVFAYELLPNFPRLLARDDLELWNTYRSGYLRDGEYAITLIYEGIEDRSYYDQYLETFLEPVYEEKVDGVSILKVWKNDDEHLKRSVDELALDGVLMTKTKEGLRFDLQKPYSLSRLEIRYNEVGCNPLELGRVRISQDLVNWMDLFGNLPRDWLIPVLGPQPSGGVFIEPFVGQEARYVDIITSPLDSCISQVKDYSFYVFK